MGEEEEDNEGEGARINQSEDYHETIAASMISKSQGSSGRASRDPSYNESSIAQSTILTKSQKIEKNM